MKLTDKLRARLGQIAAELKALNEKMSAEGYAETAEDKAAWDKLMADSKAVKVQVR